MIWWFKLKQINIILIIKLGFNLTNVRIVLDAQIDVLLDAEAEIASDWEVLPIQLVFFHLRIEKNEW